MWPFDRKKKLNESQPEVNRQLYEQLVRTQEELNQYREHGTSDPMLLAQSKMIREALKSGRDSGITNYQVSAAFSAIYMKVAETRKKLIREVDKMRQFYIVDVILTQLTEDALSPNIGTGDIIKVGSDRQEINDEIELLDEKFDFDQLILTITPDLLAQGEYTLATEIRRAPGVDAPQEANLREDYLPTGPGGPNTSGTTPTYQPTDAQPNGQPINSVPASKANGLKYGLIDLHDTVDQSGVVALTKWTSPEGYLVAKGGTNSKNPTLISKADPADFIKFSLSAQRVRIDVFKEFGIKRDNLPDDLKNIPRFLRVGKSMIYGISSKLKELELLEALVPATKLSKLSNGTLVGVNVPATYDISKGIEASKTIEGLINKKIGVDPILQEITVENIMGTAGRLKCVPIFGDNGKLQKLDYKQDEPDELLASVEDLRKVILTFMGIPYELIFGEEDSKGSTLKKYARYLRKLKSIQKAIEEGIRQIIYVHLSNKGIEFSTEDIKVEFYNKLIEVDILDKLEFTDTTINFLKGTKDFIMDLAQDANLGPHIDLIQLGKYINETLNTVGFHDIIMDVEHAAPGRPVSLPTDDPTQPIQTVVPQNPPITPQAHSGHNALVQQLARNKPRKFISKKPDEPK